MFGQGAAINIVGIASEGALVAGICAAQVARSGGSVNLLCIKPNGNLGVEIPKQSILPLPTYIVDNTIKTGETVRNVADALRGMGFSISGAVTMYDYKIKKYRNATYYQDLSENIGVEINSLFSVRDVLECCREPEVTAMKEYVRVSCQF